MIPEDQRSYDGKKCTHEWCDIVTVRTEFDFVLIRVSIVCQYRDSVTHAVLTVWKCFCCTLCLELTFDKSSVETSRYYNHQSNGCW